MTLYSYIWNAGWDFNRIDGIPYYNEDGNTIDHRMLERDDQMIAWSYVLPSDRVLELGGRYGTVSCLVNNRLDDPTKHVMIEPDDKVIAALLRNRDSHNSFFSVYQNVISSQDMMLTDQGYGTRAITTIL